MRAKVLKISLVFAALVAAPLVASWATYPSEQVWCAARAPSFEDRGPGFELINWARGEAWATLNWTEEDYAEFSPPLAWSLWFKNDPRVAVADRASFARSPGCSEDGQYSYMDAFGRTFVLVARVRAINDGGDSNGLISGAVVEKHHFLRYDAGRTVQALTNEVGERFIAVTTPLRAPATEPELPDGWTLEKIALTEDSDVALDGVVSVLRLTNGVSFQGPVSLVE